MCEACGTPKRDAYHEAVRQALVNDGWMISHDPVKPGLCEKDPLAAFKTGPILNANKGTNKIAVEVVSFVVGSDGQIPLHSIKDHIIQKIRIAEKDVDRVFYLAVSEEMYWKIVEGPIDHELFDRGVIRLLVIDESREVITRWIP